MTVEVAGQGPAPAKIMLVGEAPGADEVRLGQPFVGASGRMLDGMLNEAKLLRNACFVTNVCRQRPPDNDLELWYSRKKKPPGPLWKQFRDGWVLDPIYNGFQNLLKEIELVKPNVIVAFGNVAMWATTGLWGITTWRGSELRADLPGHRPKVIPVVHPALILRQYIYRKSAVRDLARVSFNQDSIEYEEVGWRFHVRPSFPDAVRWLENLLASLTAPTRISFDLETRGGHIACAGFATDDREGFCIPLMCVERKEGYWTAGEEAVIVGLIQRILTHPNAQVIGQNLLYDSQYTYRWWHFIPRVAQDTMISHHTAFCELPKALDFQASLYCRRYVYWKDDGKEWAKKMGEDQLWGYNCEDACRTYECATTTKRTIEARQLQLVEEFQQKLFWPVLQAMNRGVRVDPKMREQFALTLMDEIAYREGWLTEVLGHSLNPRSAPQMQQLFYHDLKMKPILKRGTGRPTLEGDALDRLAMREPILRPLVNKISEIRSLGVFLSTFVRAPLDRDGRMRCSYNICGTITFRFSSSKNAFNSGTNLQNIPKGGEDEELELPNIRKLFIPDPGYTFFDIDLDRADLQVVVWEAEDTELKQMLLEGVDIHAENAKVLHVSRPLAKSWVHGTNYGGSPRTMAANCGISVHEAERMRTRWMSAHPGIKKWHERTEDQLFNRRYIENRLGYRWYVFDRPDGLLPEALAWVPQSTVACVINRAWMRIYEQAPEIQVLLQVHDSLAGQFPSHLADQCVSKLEKLSRIEIPYSDPLVIPTGIKTSKVSWGDCA